MVKIHLVLRKHMQGTLEFGQRRYRWDTGQPLDLSLPLRAGAANPNCFGAPWPDFAPVELPEFGFIGAVDRGGPVNFFNVRFNPHGNGTHTECLGHITAAQQTLSQQLRHFHFFSKVVSCYPQRRDDGDRVVEKEQLVELIAPGEATALVLRTLPNTTDKRLRQYSGTNPPYLAAAAVDYLVDCGIEHLLIDLPSVDREEDGGALAAHRAFWRPESPVPRAQATITELIFVPDQVPDGYYLLNLQVTALELDASPSRPVLYALEVLTPEEER